ncbi:MAG: DUF3772 domain-containing protein [Kiloniellales bacterium]|nr:DUF3772 domain-containing protein [Kiloniellales bacterium]
MSRAWLIPALVAALLATGGPAFAQATSGQAAPTETRAVPSEAATAPAEAMPPARPGQEELRQRIERWTRILERVDAQLQDADLSPAVLAELDSTVDAVRRQLNEVRRPLQTEVSRLNALVDALGPPPTEGAAPEAESVASQRRYLNELLTTPAGQLKSIDVLIQATGLLVDQIADAQREVLTAELLVRTPSVLSFDTWSSAVADLAIWSGRILTVPGQWYNSPEVGAAGSGYLAGIFIAVFAAGALGWYLRRWLLRHFARDPEIEEPSYRTRVLAGFAETTANVAIPILVVAAAYGALLSRGLMFGPFQSLALGVLFAVVAVSLLRGLPKALLSPSMPHWRLVNLGDLAARLWYRRAVTLAVILGIDQLILFSFAAVEPSLSLRYAYAFVVDGAIAVVFLATTLDNRLWLSPEEDARAVAARAGETPEPPLEESEGRSNWWLVFRVLITGLAIAVPTVSLIGYGVLAIYIGERMVVSTGILLLGVVFHGLARDLAAVLTSSDDKPPAPDEAPSPIFVWTLLLIDIAIFSAVVVFLVPLWGGRWDNVFERIGWALSGISVGGRSFSPADVLIGIAVFVVLIMVVRFLQRFINRRVLMQTRMDVGVRNAINTGFGYAGFVLAALVGIDTAGVDLSGLAIIAGALSVGIGFGMQSIVNNFVSGLILLIERPIKVGDWIVVGQDQGTVKRISVRSTEILTFSNASVIIPNSELIAGRVTNWMYKDRSGRIELKVGVAYGSDTDQVRRVLLDCARGHPGIKPWPQPYVVFMDFGDSALLFELRFFIRDMNNYLAISSDLRFAIDAAFREAGITIPFPQRDVHVYQQGALAAAPEAAAAAPSGKVLPMRGGKRPEDLPDQDGET